MRHYRLQYLVHLFEQLEQQGIISMLNQYTQPGFGLTQVPQLDATLPHELF